MRLLPHFETWAKCNVQYAEWESAWSFLLFLSFEMSVNVAGGRVCTSVRTAAPIEFSLQVLDEFEPGSPVVQYLMSGASASVAALNDGHLQRGTTCCVDDLFGVFLFLFFWVWCCRTRRECGDTVAMQREIVALLQRISSQRRAQW